MKYLIVFLVIHINLSAQDVALPVLRANCSLDYASLDTLQNGEVWGWHSGPLGNGKASSTLYNTSKNSYEVENVYDLDLTTAWVEGSEDFGIGEWIEFSLSFRYPYKFNGFLEVFNGYCKSEELWNANSRVKKMELYINDNLVARLELEDTWRYQSINLNDVIDLNSLNNGDIIKFKIIEVYPGAKYKDVAISELVTPSFGGG